MALRTPNGRGAQAEVGIEGTLWTVVHGNSNSLDREDRERALAGWRFCAAMLDLQRGVWVARAVHADGRTLVARVRGEDGPVAAEEAIRAMASPTMAKRGTLQPRLIL